MAVAEVAGATGTLFGAPPAPTVAVVHDYLTQRGGAERVVLSLARAFPGAPVHTSMYDPAETYPEFADLPIRTTSLDYVSPLRRNHRMALPLLPRSFSRMEIGADVVLCSSSGWAHGVHTDGRKVVYCHNPARWLYQADGYEAGSGRMASAGLTVMRGSLQRWDRRAARTADRYLANSSVVRDRIRAAYGIDAEVLPPPYALDPSGPMQAIEGIDAGFILCVSRLMSYKNVDAVAEGMRGLPDRQLVVVGSGPEAERLQATSPSNVRFVGSVDDAQLRWLYDRSVGLVSASYEDFGLTPIEAAAFGKPSALLRWGGFLDSLDEGISGLYFDEPTPMSAGEAMRALVRENWDARAIRDHASTYSEERFLARIREITQEEAAQHRAGPPATHAPRLHAAGATTAPGTAPTALLPPVAAPARATRSAPVVSALRGLATKVAVAASDLVAVTVAMALAFAAWTAMRGADPASFGRDHVTLAALSLPIWLAALAHCDLYLSRIVTSRMEEMRRLAKATALAMLGTAAVSGLTRLEAARLWYVLSTSFGFLALVGSRAVVRSMFLRRRRTGRRLRHIVVVGTNDEALELARALRNDVALGYRVVGFLSDEYPAGFEIGGHGVVLGGIDQALSAVRRTGATGALIVTAAVDNARCARLTDELAEVGVHVELSSSLRDVSLRRMTIRPVGRYPIIYVEPQTRGSWRVIAKRAFDVVLAVAGLVLLSPVLAVAAVAVKLGDGGPVFFRQRRVGRGGVTFELIKLRSMVPDAESRLIDLRDANEAQGPLFKMRNDPRVTRVGRVLRRSSIDELPQLWNVLRGDMSIVGPRPALAGEMGSWSPEMHARLKFRPGITGMWQVNGRSSASAEDYERLDLYYVNNWSFLTDLAIVVRTVPAVFATRGAY